MQKWLRVFWLCLQTLSINAIERLNENGIYVYVGCTVTCTRFDIQPTITLSCEARYHRSNTAHKLKYHPNISIQSTYENPLYEKNDTKHLYQCFIYHVDSSISSFYGFEFTKPCVTQEKEKICHHYHHQMSNNRIKKLSTIADHETIAMLLSTISKGFFVCKKTIIYGKYSALLQLQRTCFFTSSALNFSNFANRKRSKNIMMSRIYI